MVDETTLSLSTENPQDIAIDIVMYPNPLSNSKQLNISIPEVVSSKVHIINEAGQIMLTGNLIQGSGTVSLNGLSTGAYVVKIVSERSTILRKIILE